MMTLYCDLDDLYYADLKACRKTPGQTCHQVDLKWSSKTLPGTGKKFFLMLVSKKWLEENPDAHAQIRKANPPRFASDIGTDSDEESEKSERDGQSHLRKRDGMECLRGRDGAECLCERSSKSSREEPVTEKCPEDGEGTSSV